MRAATGRRRSRNRARVTSMQLLLRRRANRFFLAAACTAVVLAASPEQASAQQASMSAWDAADFRVWAYIPYWDTSSIGTFATDGSYKHVSDVLYFGAVRPDANGNLPYAS